MGSARVPRRVHVYVNSHFDFNGARPPVPTGSDSLPPHVDVEVCRSLVFGARCQASRVLRHVNARVLRHGRRFQWTSRQIASPCQRSGRSFNRFGARSVKRRPGDKRVLVTSFWESPARWLVFVWVLPVCLVLFMFISSVHAFWGALCEAEPWPPDRPRHQSLRI